MGVPQQGRKSAAHVIHKPPPPTFSNMPAKEAAICRQIVDAMPHGWFNPTNEPLLRALCSSMVTFEAANAELKAAFKTDHWAKIDKWSRVRAHASRTVGDMSQKLRLTPKARLTPEKAAVRRALNSTTRPWEVRH
jgi:hypothetical protein